MVDFSDFLYELQFPLFEGLNPGDMRVAEWWGGQRPPVRFHGLKIPFVLAEPMDGEGSAR